LLVFVFVQKSYLSLLILIDLNWASILKMCNI